MEIITNFFDFNNPLYLEHPYGYIGIKIAILIGLGIMACVGWFLLTLCADMMIEVLNWFLSFVTNKRIPMFHEYAGSNDPIPPMTNSAFPQGKRTVAPEQYQVQVRMDNGWLTVGNVNGDGANSQTYMENIQRQFNGRQVRLATYNGQVVDIM